MEGKDGKRKVTKFDKVGVRDETKKNAGGGGIWPEEEEVMLSSLNELLISAEGVVQWGNHSIKTFHLAARKGKKIGWKEYFHNPRTARNQDLKDLR